MHCEFVVSQYKPSKEIHARHCIKSVLIRSFFSPYFLAFGLYSVRIRIQSECGKIRTRKTPNTDSFYAVKSYKYKHSKHVSETHSERSETSKMGFFRKKLTAKNYLVKD